MRDAPARLLPTSRQIGGAALTLGGLAADGAVGLAILRGGAPWLLLVHLPAALVWAEGISLAEGRSLCRAISHRLLRCALPGTPPLNGRTLMLALIGLLLFPGFGTLGCTIALVLSSLRVMAHHQRAFPPTEIEAGLPALPPERATNAALDLAIEPLVDILREPDHALRHAAVRLLGRRCDRESVALLRGLLADADPDIRSEASTTLFNFENQLNRAVGDALDRVRREPERADAHVALAATYRRVVDCDLLDAPSARLYLTRACDALQAATALEPSCAHHWVALAHIQNDLDDTAAASDAVAGALRLDPGERAAHLLAMELAFREQRWADLAVYAAGAGDAPDTHESELLDWWAASASGVATAKAGTA
ncbi:MAG: HEAT repeat domain-containing protein [Thermomicrobiales bacterium]